MAISEFSAALKQVAAERGIPEHAVIETLQTALVSAYKRDYGFSATDEVNATIDMDTGEVRIIKNEEDVTPSGFGRIAAQTAKQVLLQKVRETEKQMVVNEFEKKIGTIVHAHIFRVERGVVIVDLGKAQGILPQSEQVSTERYAVNQKLKVLIKDIRQTTRGLEIIVSRADVEFVKALFAMEVPEVATGTVVIEAIAREPGSRTKMAVSSREANIDPVGSCVGQKGVRVQAIISELHGEKIDIVPYSMEPDKFIASSLSPAKVADVVVDRDTKEARVIVPDDQLSLAIGKEGQNVRLAHKLTNWKIDIKGLFGGLPDVPADSDEDSANAAAENTETEQVTTQEPAESTEKEESNEEEK